MKTLLDSGNDVNMARRSFLRYAGVGAVAATGVMAIASCKKHNNEGVTSTVDIGTGDIGILNYAYALEQLEAAFYLQVALTPYTALRKLKQPC
jgi:hypothetical protein